MQKTRDLEVEVQTALKEMKKEHVSARDTAALEDLEAEPEAEDLMSLLEILAKVGGFPFNAYKARGDGAGGTKTLIRMRQSSGETCPGCGNGVNDFDSRGMVAKEAQCQGCGPTGFFSWCYIAKNWKMV